MRTRSLLLAVLLAATPACVTVGHRFDPARADQLVPGTSTLADAEQLLGKHTSETDLGNGQILYQWQYSQGTALGTGSGAVVGILFDDAGRMIRIAHRSRTTLR